MLDKEQIQEKFDNYFKDLLYYNAKIKEERLHKEFNKTMQNTLIGIVIALAEVLEDDENHKRISKFLKEKIETQLVK